MNVQEKIATLDTQLKSRINEQKTNRARISFKNVEEIDGQISRLDKQVESAQMKIVDEKKALAEISNLKKLRKNFAGFDEAEKGINDIKGKILEIRKSMDNPEAKALSDRYNEIAKELDEIKASQDEVYKNLNSLRDERTELQKDQQAKYTAMKTIKDDYYGQKKAYHEYEQELKKARQEKWKAENEVYANEKRKKVAAEKLEEASQPAYLDEIMTANGLIHFFDPSSIPETKPLRGPSGYAAESQRTIDNSDIKGTVLSKKDDRDDTYFAGTGGKKGKKGKKSPNSTTTANNTEAGKFNLTMGVIEQLTKVNVDAPTKQSDIPEVVEKLKAKVAKWEIDSEAKTKEVIFQYHPSFPTSTNIKQNIAKAQAEIDRLGADTVTETPEGSHDTAKKPSLANYGLVNRKSSPQAELAQEENGVEDVSKELEAAKLEDA